MITLLRHYYLLSCATSVYAVCDFRVNQGTRDHRVFRVLLDYQVQG